MKPVQTHLFFIAACLWMLSTGHVWGVTPPPDATWTWQTLDCHGTPTGRHETSFVGVDGYFYLIGGREANGAIDRFDPKTNTWDTMKAKSPLIHHFQPVVLDGKVWMVGAMTGGFPKEPPMTHIQIYDPKADVWMQGPQIPQERRRGSAGTAVYNGKIYMVGGITLGHTSGTNAWFDEFDPKANTWKRLPDAPHIRDHFHAVVLDDKLYCIGGRNTSYRDPANPERWQVFFGAVIPEIDVYDFKTGTWSVLDSEYGLPNGSAAGGTAVLGNRIVYFGGENDQKALDDCWAFDPKTQTWTKLASMKQGRHGSQAIVYNNKIYIAAGSPNRGGGNLTSIEMFSKPSLSGALELAQPMIAPDVVFEEVNGLVAVEAEHFYKQTFTDIRQWYIIADQTVPDVKPNPSPSHVEGASGGAYLKCLPDTRVTHADPLVHGVSFSNVPGKLAILHYKVHFNTPGRYYVWARCYSTGPEDNGIHVGLNGQWPDSGQRMQWCDGKHSWRWESKQRTDQQHCGVEHGIYLDIPSPGIHDIQFSMREDGFEFDKFIMTMDRDFARPDDAGPSPRLKSGTLPPLMAAAAPQKRTPKTKVTIKGEQFFINGKPTYAGRTWQGHKIEGLLMNARLVQGVFDDLNPETVGRWAYPDTGKWCPDRNTDGFISAMREWRRHGLLAFTINFQGGSPEGYSQSQPWHNSAFKADGSLRPAYADRMGRIVDFADDLGMVAIVGIFYFGQDQRLEDETAVKQAVINTVDWIADRGYTNVLLEIANEHNIIYSHDIIRRRPHELVTLAQQRAAERSLNLPVSCSLSGGAIPSQKLVDVSDFIFLHGNGVNDPARMVQMIETVRKMAGNKPKPIVNNEDDRPWRGQGNHGANWGTEGTTNNFVACARNYASWGYFDFRERNEGFNEGFQSIPVNWQISSDRKRAFFNLVAEITGADAN